MSPPVKNRIVGILLAAGAGRRFDPAGLRNKLLQTTAAGDAVAVAAAKTLLSTLPLVIAVVRDANGPVAAALSAAGCTVAACTDADRGMGVSLAHGVRHAADADGWIVALGDMPYVKPDTIAQLADALKNGADIAVPVCNQRRGHPVGFGSFHLEALLQLNEDRGARALLDTFAVLRIAVDDPGIHRDIDTPADLD
jgi:molybdenum cofactor cytidylyltransferase